MCGLWMYRGRWHKVNLVSFSSYSGVWMVMRCDWRTILFRGFHWWYPYQPGCDQRSIRRTVQHAVVAADRRRTSKHSRWSQHWSQIDAGILCKVVVVVVLVVVLAVVVVVVFAGKWRIQRNVWWAKATKKSYIIIVESRSVTLSVTQMCVCHVNQTLKFGRFFGV